MSIDAYGEALKIFGGILIRGLGHMTGGKLTFGGDD